MCVFKTNSLSMDEDDPRCSLIVAAGSRWKRMRNIMNPTFSTAKLREVGFKFIFEPVLNIFYDFID